MRYLINILKDIQYLSYLHQGAFKKELEHLVKKIKTSVRQGLTNGVQSTFSMTKEARENSLDKTSA